MPLKPWAIITTNGAIESRHASRELASASRDKYILPNRDHYWLPTQVVYWPEFGQPGRSAAIRGIFSRLYRDLHCPRPEVPELC